MTEYAPPHDLDAEGAVLGALLTEPRHLPAVQAVLPTPAAFYAGANQRIYGAILDVAANGRAVDAATVAARLRDQGRLDEIGGTPYLARLSDATPAVAHVADHARIVRAKWQRRQLIDVIRRAKAEARGDIPDVGAWIESTIARLRHACGHDERRLHLLSGDAIFGAFEPPEMVVDEVARRGSLVLIAGYGGGCKTWMALDLLVAVATGGKWLGRFPCRRGRAILIDYEGGKDECRRRLKAIAAALDLAQIDSLDVASYPPLDLGTSEFASAVRDLARSASVIVIDSLRAATRRADENASIIRAGLDDLHAIGDETGCTFFVLAHARKQGDADVSEREMIRGSSAIFDAADTVLYVTASRTQRGTSRVVQAKARHGREVAPFVVSLDNLTTNLGPGVVVSSRDADPDGGHRADELDSQIFAAVARAPGCSRAQIRRAVPRSAALVDATVARLLQSRALEDRGTASRAALYVASSRVSDAADAVEAQPDPSQATPRDKEKTTNGQRKRSAKHRVRGSETPDAT